MKKPTKKEIQKWVRALRSGKFEQTTGTLEDANGHCCLGVACKIFIPKNKLKLSHGFLEGAVPVDYQIAAPSWLKKVNRSFNVLTRESLANLNDGTGSVEKFTFDEIAEQLELAFIHRAYD